MEAAFSFQLSALSFQFSSIRAGRPLFIFWKSLLDESAFTDS
jgi:hypothetical protein